MHVLRRCGLLVLGYLPTTVMVRCCRPKAGALAEERDSLRQQLELERTAAAEAQQQVRRGHLKAVLVDAACWGSQQACCVRI